MISQYDIVIACRQLDEQIKPGTQGTVLMVYHSDPIEFEVEFVDDNQETLALLTVSLKDIEKLKSN